nr:zinc finger, CCHC-type [Tanacetum cinerariifolium]
MKDITSKFDKLAKFEGQDFHRWQKKMHFLLTTLNVMYVLSTPSAVWSENETLEMTRKRMKWENDDYIFHGHILNGMSDSLVDIYQNAKSTKALWESLESKYMAEDAFATKFLELDNNLKGKNQIGSSSVNMVERDGVKNSNNNKNKRKFKSGDDKFANKKGTITCWKCKNTSHVKKDCRSRKGNDGAGSNGPKDHEKKQGYNYDFMQNFVNVLHYVSVISDAFYVQDDEVAAIVRLTEPKMKNLNEKGIECIFIGYAEHSKCYRFYVLETNYYVSVNSIIESKDAIFDEEQFTSIPRSRCMIQPSLSKIAEDEVAGTDDVPGLSVPRKSTRTRKAKSFGSDFQLYFVEGTRDKTLSQRVYYFIIDEDPRTLSEAMASRDVAIHDQVIHQMDVKTTFLNGDLDEKIYMKQHEGFVMPGHESKVEGTDDVPGPSVPRKSTETRKAKSFGSDFQLYLVEGTRDKTFST